MTKNRKIIDEVRDVMRLHHYSIHTERTYCDWIRRLIRFHKMQSRDDLKDGEYKIESFLTHQAVHANVAPATQNQAMNALIFLYRKVLKLELAGAISAIRAKTKENFSVVLSRDETGKLLSMMAGTPQLVAKLLYGSGLRISEVIRLRVHDIDFSMKNLTVRSGKGNKDRITTFPVSLMPFLSIHLVKVKHTHQMDLAKGYGSVYMPYALDRKYPNAAKEWGWQYVFPSSKLSKDPRSDAVRRHHIDPT